MISDKKNAKVTRSGHLFEFNFLPFVDLFFTAQPLSFTFCLDGRVVSLVVGGEGFELTAS